MIHVLFLSLNEAFKLGRSGSCLGYLSLISLPLSPSVSTKTSRKYKMGAGENVIDLTYQLEEKPGNTENEYSQFRLPNGIEVTCVRVPNSEKSAAALSVRAGAQDDTLAGLAHFTEHAVFLGSDKFRGENEFKSHLSKNGGSSNGGTSMDMTTFQFDVRNNAFESTLDIWSNFFVKPLFRDDAIGREVMAVTAEDSKNRILDSRRMLQVLKSVMVPSENWTKFSTGNVDTLSFGKADENAKDLAQIMKRFHQLNYQPNKMSLAICGPQEMTELKRLAVKYFQGISAPEIDESIVSDAERNGLGEFSPASLPVQSQPVYENGSEGARSGKSISNVEAWRAGWEDYLRVYEELSRNNHGYPFAQETLGSLLRVRPVKEIRDMSIMVGLPPVRKNYRKNPLRLLAQVVSAKGEGSLFAALQDLGWATSAGGSTRVDTPSFSVFEVSVGLTPKGYEHYEEVLTLIYSHLRFLTTVELQDYHRTWAEIRAQNKIGFNFQEKATPYSLAPYLCRQMAHYPLPHILSEGWLLDPLEDQDVTTVKEYLSRLAEPSNTVVVLRNRDDFAWLPDDDVNATSPSAAASLIPTFSPTATVTTGPNRVEYNYGVPFHMEKLDDRLVDACRSSGTMDEALSTMAATGRVGDASPEVRASIKSAFAPPNQYICTLEELEAAIPSSGIMGKVEGDKKRSQPPSALESVSEQAAADPGIPFGPPLTLRREEVWASKDEMFAQPRSQLNSYVQSYEGADGSPINGIISSVFYQTVARKYQPASQAGLSYSVSTGTKGVGFSFRGYSPRLLALATDVVDTFTDPAFWKAVPDRLIDVVKERTVRNLQSWKKERPDSQADRILSYLLSLSSKYLPQERLALAETITANEVRQRAMNMATREGNGSIGVLTYGHGSLSASDALTFHNKVKDSFQAPAATTESLQHMQAEKGYGMIEPSTQARLLPASSHSIVMMKTPNEEDENSALLVHFQTDRMDPMTSARMLWLRRYLHEPMFNKLRTKKQLGYIVSMGSGGYGPLKGMKSMRGFTARILSNRYSPPVMQRELEIFLREMEGRLSTLTPEDVQQRSDAIVASLLDPPTSYSEEADEYWGAILDECTFEWTQLCVAELRNLEVSDIQQCYSKWFINRVGGIGTVPGVHPASDGGMRSCAVMLFGKGKTASLDPVVFNAESDESCQLTPLTEVGLPSLFPPFAAYSKKAIVTGEEDSAVTLASDSGVKPGLLVTSMEGLKEARELLDLFDPPPPEAYR